MKVNNSLLPFSFSYLFVGWSYNLSHSPCGACCDDHLPSYSFIFYFLKSVCEIIGSKGFSVLILWNLCSAGKKVSSRKDELRELVEHFNVSFCLSFKFQSSN